MAVDPTQQINGTLIDTATLVTQTAPEDSVITSGLANTPLAYFKDPVLGNTESNMITAINPPTSYTIPKGTVTIDSALLVLRYASDFYGDSLTSKYKVNVYQLTDRPNPAATYYSNSDWNYNNSTVLGSKTFNARPNTSIKITDVVTGKADTLKTVRAQVRVKLDPAFIQNVLFSADSVTTSSSNLFQKRSKGLYITLDKNQVGNGGRMYFQLDSSSIDVYYKNTTSSAVDTSLVSLPFANHSAQIKHGYSTAVTSSLNSPVSQETVYLDGLVGLRTKVSFPYLKNILATAGGDIVLNRAELVISPAPGTDIPFAPLPKLTMYRLDIAKQRTYIPDAQGNLTTSNIATDPRFIDPSVFGGYYDPAKREYHFVITGYISDLMRGKTVDYGTYIAPDQNAASTTTVNIATTTAATGRTVAVGAVTNKNAANYPYRMRLNIIYTKAAR